MHGSPCQDFSVAGKQAGGDEGTGTRSSLMYETIRIVDKLKPKYVIWENVKNLLSQKHKHNFDNYIEQMNELGYNSYYQVLNSKDYGIPQNRERIFTISIRKDIDKGYIFPEKEELKLRLKDMLETEVNEKYYLSDIVIQKITYSNFAQERTRIQEKDYCDTLLSRDWKDPKCVRIGGIFDTETSTHQAGSIYDKDGLSPTLDIMQGGWRQPSIITHNVTQKVKVRLYPVDVETLKNTLRNAKLNVDLNNKEIADILQIPQTQVEHYFRTDSSFAIPSPEIWLKLKEILKIETNYFDESIMTFEEKDNEYDISNRIYDEEGIAPTQTIQNDTKILIKNNTKLGFLEAEDGDGVYTNPSNKRGMVQKGMAQTLTGFQDKGVITNNLRIRKLTPLECWRLQGFDDEDFYKAKERLNNAFYKGRDNSNSQLYKQVGNSITVNVLEKIFNNLFKEN